MEEDALMQRSGSRGRINVFGPQGDTIRRLLAQTLLGVVAPRLLTREGGGRVALQEILLNTLRVRQVIRAGQTDLTLAMEAGRAEGMQQWTTPCLPPTWQNKLS